MTRPTDTSFSKVVDLPASFGALDDLPREERVSLAMVLASHFLEYAAYEAALERNAFEVSELIELAARLEYSAERHFRGKLL